MLEPVKALLAHFGGQNGYAFTREQLGVERAAAAIVAGGGPNGLVIGGVELAGHEARGQAAVACAHLMAAGGEPLAAKNDDPGVHTREGAGDFDEVDPAILAALHGGLVMPGDAEQVKGIHIPKAHVLEALLDLFRHLIRIPHLGKGGQYDVVLPRLLNVVRQVLFVHFQIDHVDTLRYTFIFRGHLSSAPS